MSNKTRLTLYIGVTSDLPRRIHELKKGTGSVFTRKYRCCDLVYFEEHQSMYRAIVREATESLASPLENPVNKITKSGNEGFE